MRQSTASQVRGNLESQRRQYALADHARAVGSLGSVGGVFCLEASRLARNNRDWHHLIDLCSLVGTLLIDPDGVYDPRLGNDRLLLGLKGTMSEFELTLFWQRSLEAKRQKAKRGELRVVLPVGLRWTSEGRIEKVPDVRVQGMLQLAFEKFHELGSIRQTLRWLREEQIQLPRTSSRRHDAPIEWALPTYASLHGLLTNPKYAGAYAFGKTTTKTVIEGDCAHTTGGHRKPMSEFTSLIRDHHPGYISWGRFEHTRRVLTGNANIRKLLKSWRAQRTRTSDTQATTGSRTEVHPYCRRQELLRRLRRQARQRAQKLTVMRLPEDARWVVEGWLGAVLPRRTLVDVHEAEGQEGRVRENQTGSRASRYELVVVQNWFEELERFVPTD